MNAKNLVEKMTVDEKISLLSGGSCMGTAEVGRLGLKSANMADGPHGLRDGTSSERNCTSFPCLSAVGASWNREIAFKMGEYIARDCIRLDKNMILGPGVNMKRIDLCGRNFEYFSEDPVLSGELAAGYINGVQSKGVGTSLKHFAVNNQELNRLYLNAEIDERTMREIYLKAFEIAVKKSNPTSVMCALNKVNGVLCSENKMLLTDILRNEWGYKGFVVSDWGCVKNTARALKAGLDLAMPDGMGYKESLKEAYNKGEVTEEEINLAAERITDFLLNIKPEKTGYDREAQHKAAREIEEECIVLLKNDNNLLPLSEGKYKKIAVIGEFADKPVVSGYGSARVYPDESMVESPIEEIKKLLPDTEITYIPLYSTSVFEEKSCFNKLPELKPIDSADAVVMFVGRQRSVETEGTDRVTSHLDPYFEFYISRIYPRNKNIILVMQSGGAVIPFGWQNKVSSIVHMWYGGEAAGSAIANILCGRVNPSGKLSETFPLKTRTDIDYPGDGYKVCYDEKWAVGYRYYDTHPEEIWYPFGHGLSYTKFEYSDIKIKPSDDGVDVTFKIKNIGSLAGKEAMQLYISDRVSTVSKPEKELKDFKKIYLEAGEEKEVTFKITEDMISYYNISLKKWTAEPGIYDVLIGASSRDIRLKAEYFYDKECEYTINYAAEQIMG